MFRWRCRCFYSFGNEPYTQTDFIWLEQVGKGRLQEPDQAPGAQQQEAGGESLVSYHLTVISYQFKCIAFGLRAPGLRALDFTKEQNTLKLITDSCQMITDD